MDPLRWGSPDAATDLPQGARDLVEMAFGLRTTPAPEPAPVPASALGEAPLAALRAAVGEEHVLLDDEVRRLRTRGKSTPDLLRARAGDLADAPDAVVRPGSHEDVAAVLAVAVEHHLAVVPFGGGTCVTGGLAARRDGYAGLVSLDLVRMKQLLAVDEESMTATLEPGLRGPEAEALQNERGLMLGHFPQSFQFASIGGFAATRSSGQSSAGYGRFDAMVVGLRVATPRGEWVLGSSPANAAGPDLRQLVLGSEGAFGVITAVTVRVRRLPEVKVYEGWRWASFSEGRDAMRHLAQHGLLPTVLRLSDESETAINLARPDAIGESGTDGACLMIVGHEGTTAQVESRRAAVTEALTALGGRPQGEGPGESWAHGRFDAPYLRDSLLDVGVLVEEVGDDDAGLVQHDVAEADAFVEGHALDGDGPAEVELHARPGEAAEIPGRDHLGDDHGRGLERLHLVVAVVAHGLVLDHEHAESAPRAQHRHAEEGVVDLFARLREIGESGMLLRVLEV